MSVRVVADSSANLVSRPEQNYYAVPMTINTDEKEYVDNEKLDVFQMLDELSAYTGRTGTACPAPGEWLDAFEGSDETICITLTGALSGCYNSAVSAADMYMEDHPGSKIFVMDTKSTGPENELLVEQAKALSGLDMSFEDKCSILKGYAKTTHLFFSLSSVDNFVRNGRVNPALGKMIKLLNIHIVGKASEAGELEPVNKCRGDRNALNHLYKNMKDAGFKGGKVRLRHTRGKRLAEELQRMILEEVPETDIKIHRNHGLCSYYAESGCLLVGFEGEA